VSADKQKRRRILIAAIAGVVAVGAFALVFVEMGTAHTSTPPAAAASTSTSKAVVALIDINVGDQVTAANVTLGDYPVAALPAAGLYYPDAKTLLGATWFSTVKLPRGQLVLATQLTPVVTPTKLPPVQLTDGYVAMSIPYDEGKDAAGFIQQDDYIDILVNDPTSKSVHYAFQGVHVLRVGTRAAQPAPGPAAAAAPVAGATVLLVEVARQQAAALAFAIDSAYPIRYVIRPHDQQTQTTLPNSGPVGATNWLTVISS
jgi:Flp pilus assembly protein CpaB